MVSDTDDERTLWMYGRERKALFGDRQGMVSVSVLPNILGMRKVIVDPVCALMPSF
jgi:hypothetical protein